MLEIGEKTPYIIFNNSRFSILLESGTNPNYYANNGHTDSFALIIELLSFLGSSVRLKLHDLWPGGDK